MKDYLNKLRKRAEARLLELRAAVEKGEGLTAEELEKIQQEITDLAEEVREIDDNIEKLDDEDDSANKDGENGEEEDEGEDDEKQHQTTPEQRSKVLDSLGQALSTRNAKSTKKREQEVRGAFANFVVGKIDEAEARSLGVVIGNGSVTIPEVIVTEIITYAAEENLLRKYGTRVRTKGDVKYPVLVKKAAANVTKIERDSSNEIPETEIEFDQITLEPAEFDALATVTKKLLAMSGAPIETIVIDELKKAYVRKEAQYMFNGDDVDNENPGALAKKAVPYYESQVVGADDQKLYKELVKFKNQPVTAVLKKSMWIVNRAALTLLEGMVDLNGRPLLHVDATDGVNYRLLGHKLDFTDDADGADATKPVFYFGDFKSFHIQDVIGAMEIQKLIEKYAGTNKIGFKIYNLLDGQLVYSPLEPTVYRYEVGATAPVGG